MGELDLCVCGEIVREDGKDLTDIARSLPRLGESLGGCLDCGFHRGVLSRRTRTNGFPGLQPEMS